MVHYSQFQPSAVGLGSYVTDKMELCIAHIVLWNISPMCNIVLFFIFGTQWQTILVCLYILAIKCSEFSKENRKRHIHVTLVRIHSVEEGFRSHPLHWETTLQTQQQRVRGHSFTIKRPHLMFILAIKISHGGRQKKIKLHEGEINHTPAA